ncbi:MAG: hypothetical protein ACT4P2_07655 [Pseudomonadota bacterium]
MSMWVRINRWLYATLALAILAVVGLPFVAGSIPAPKLPPVTVPPIKVAEPHQTQVSLPTRNIFDRDGTRWEPPVPVAEAPPAAPAKPKARIRGVARLGDTAGILTDKEFLAVGQEFDERRIQAVGEGRAIVGTLGTGFEELVVDPEREERRKKLRVPPDPRERPAPARKTQ